MDNLKLKKYIGFALIFLLLGASMYTEFESIKLRQDPGIVLSHGDSISNRTAGIINMRGSTIWAEKLLSDSTTSVVVGTEANEYAQDSAGVEAAMKKAKALVTSRGKRVTVIFKEGYYNLGYGRISLKDSVDMTFTNKCIFYSNSTAGTFSDDTVYALSYWDGKPDIRNLGGVKYRIVFGNGTSRVIGFFWKYVALISQAGTDNPTAIVGENDFRDSVTYTRVSQGVYNLAMIKGAFPENRTYCVALLSGYSMDGGAEALVYLYRIDDNNLALRVFNIAGNPVDEFTNCMIQIWIYPQALLNHTPFLP